MKEDSAQSAELNSEDGYCMVQSADSLWPIIDRLTTLKEMLRPEPGDEPLELSDSGRRGISYLIGDICAQIEKAAEEFNNVLYGLENGTLAPASRQKGKGSDGHRSKHSPCKNIPKEGDCVN